MFDGGIINKYYPHDISVLSFHEVSTISLLGTRRQIQLSKIMFNQVQNNKFRKTEAHATLAANTYVFNTDIVRLGIYSNSPYYRGVKPSNDLPMEIRSIQDKRTFDYRLKGHSEMIAK